MENHVDVIIVGTGLAGSYTALNLPSHLNIVMLSAHEDNSSLAQGGIASCINKEDSFDAHMEDTLNAGHYINDPQAVKQLVESGPSNISALQTLGVGFDTGKNGQVSTTIEGGHSKSRVLHINGDQTGKGIMDVLHTEIQNRDNIEVLFDSHIIELLTDESNRAITGIIYEQNNQFATLLSYHVVIATGGMGNLYPYTTNHYGSYGIGIALAKEIGARTRDLHLMQFHPTAFYSEEQQRYFLISEALRGEGAHLLNTHMERFMLKVDKRAELAPRDIVSKAIYEEMMLSKKSFVYLDTRHLGTTFMSERFPAISSHLSKHGFTLGKDLIPVTPVAHYTVGGIEVDYNGMTNIEGLYACGEVASTGVHGANRLASNSLLECLVYGSNVASHITGELSYGSTSEDRLIKWPQCNQSGFKDIKNDASNAINQIQKVMQKHVGIRRTDKDLESASNKIEIIKKQVEPKRFCSLSAFHAYHMTELALEVVNDALNNSSIGCHYKVDSREEQKIC